MVVVEEEVDVILMEGFDLVKVDEIFGLFEKGLKLLILLLLGYCDVDKDWLYGWVKVCCLCEDFVIEYK